MHYDNVLCLIFTLPICSTKFPRVLETLSQPGGLPESEITVADLLKAQGYNTGMGGKWHLGLNKHTDKDGSHLPVNHGFDDYLGDPFTNMDACKQGHESSIFCTLYANDTIIQQPIKMENLTLELTRHAVDFITRQAEADTPFFYYMSWLHVHTALFSSPWFTNRSAGGAYGDNVEELDWSAGQILKTVRALGIEQDTLVLFTSDNGPFLEEGQSAGSAGGLTGGKGQTWEGGIRMPGIAWWPGHVPANTTSDTLVSTMDVLPTLTALAGGQPPATVLDGLDITSVLADPIGAPSPHDFFFHYCGENITAVRHGKYKIHFQTTNWTSPDIPDAPCQQCCPKGPGLRKFGTCSCDKNLIPRNPPLIYDMSVDRNEHSPLTPANFTNFDDEVAAASAAVQAHYNTINPVEHQLHTLVEPWLQPCCGGLSHGCECFNEVPMLLPTVEDLGPDGAQDRPRSSPVMMSQ